MEGAVVAVVKVISAVYRGSAKEEDIIAFNKKVNVLKTRVIWISVAII